MSVAARPSTNLQALLGSPGAANREAIVVRMRAVDPDLARHAASVAALVGCMAAAMPSLSLTDRVAIVDAAWLHDLGKLIVPRPILDKPGPLTDDEWDLMRAHPASGGAYLDESTTLRPLAPFVAQHHEWHDGHGYPLGLAGGHIEVGARLIGVADAYDAMTTWRPYRAARCDSDAISELRRCAGTQFDPAIVELFIHSTVALRGGEQA